MDTNTVFGMLMGKISKVSNSVKSILSGIVSITNVNDKIHYEFTDGTSADFDVQQNVELSVDYETGDLIVE